LVNRLVIALGAISIAAAATPSKLAAQRWADLSALRSGDTLRVWATQPRLNGTVGLLDRLERDTLGLRSFAGSRPLPAGLAVAIPALTRLDVRRGLRRSVGWSVAGVVLGAAIGTVVGAYSGVLIECGGSCSDEPGDLAGLAGFVLGGGVGGIAGGIAGGIIGARRRPYWQPVGLPSR
jgi:hypothetical protein